MIHGQRLCAVIPARGGSKGIPRKNLYKINGVTLVERAMNLSEACSRIDKTYVSTDDPETYALALAKGCATPKLRPASLSTDASRTIDLIKHMVREGLLLLGECLVLLQPTSPLRTLADLDAACDLLEARWEDADAVVSVYEISEPHPYKAQVFRDGYLRSLLGHKLATPRQLLPKTYVPNGAFYVGKLTVYEKEETFIPARSVPLLMPETASLNLDRPLDLVLLEALLSKRLVQVVSDAELRSK